MGSNTLHRESRFEDISNIYGDVRDIPKENNGLSRNRPWFSGNQIRNAEELKPGMIVIYYHGGSGDAIYYRIDGEVYGESEDARVKVSEMKNGKVIFTCDIYLVDNSIVLYNNGFWNSANCLLKTRSKKTKLIRLPKDLLVAA